MAVSRLRNSGSPPGRQEPRACNAYCTSMAKGHDSSDWTVLHSGDEGTISGGAYRARFRVRSTGVVQIIWKIGPEPKDEGPINRAAQEAIDAAIRPRA